MVVDKCDYDYPLSDGRCLTTQGDKEGEYEFHVKKPDHVKVRYKRVLFWSVLQSVEYMYGKGTIFVDLS